MTQTDPLNPKGQLFKDKCVYLVGTPGHGTTSCKIMAGDVDIATIPEFHRNFYNNECIDYPNKNDPTEWSGSGVNIKPIVDGRGACAFRRIIINIGTGS